MPSERAEGTSVEVKLRSGGRGFPEGVLRRHLMSPPSLMLLIALGPLLIHSPQLLWEEPSFRVSLGFEPWVCHSLTG